jgi:hypothetical protein
MPDLDDLSPIFRKWLLRMPTTTEGATSGQCHANRHQAERPWLGDWIGRTGWRGLTWRQIGYRNEVAVAVDVIHGE